MTSATFIDYLVGGLVATVAIFTPIYPGVVPPGRRLVRHRGDPQVAAFVRGATAAAAGAIAGATVVLTPPGRHRLAHRRNRAGGAGAVVALQAA